MMKKLKYLKCGDYLIPALRLDNEPEETRSHYSIYGRMREIYLREYRSGTYTSMLMTGRLHEHLVEVDAAAWKLRNKLMEKMAEREGVTEELKAADQMRWVQMMNSIRASAEEVVKAELIYN